MNHSKSSVSFQDQLVFRVRDFRNGKFQGSLQQKSLRPHGPGMFLDTNFTLTLSQWKHGRPHGQTFYLDSAKSVLYGPIINSLPTGLCCYQVSAMTHIYGYLSNSKIHFAVDCQQANTLITLIFTIPSWQDLVSNLQSYDFSVLAWDSANSNQKKQQRKLLSNPAITYYRSQQQKWSKIQQFLQLAVDLQMKDYKQYVKLNFGQSQPDGTQLSVLQAKEEFQLRHKMSSIVCKLSDRQDVPNHFQVKLLGYYNAIDGTMEIQRKRHRLGQVVEEVFGQQEYQYDYEGKRPAACYKKASNYFQQSLTFTNDIVAIHSLQNLANLFRGIAQYASSQQTSNYAQTLLQQPIPQQKPIGTPKNKQNAKKKQEEISYLQIVRRDVEEKAQRRSRRSRQPNQAQGQSPGYEAVLPRKVMPYPSRFQAQQPKSQYEESGVSHKHRFSYLQESEGGQTTFRSKSRNKISHNKYSYVPNSPKRGRTNLRYLSPKNHQQDQITATRSVYHEQYSNGANLQQLTQDYARIQDQLKRETSRGKKRFSQYPTPRRSRPQPSYYPSPQSRFTQTPREASVSPGRSRQFQYVPPSPVATPSRRKWR